MKKSMRRILNRLTV